MKKRLSVLLFVFVLLFGGFAPNLSVMAATTGWKQASGHWYYYTSKGKATGWLLYSGKWYYFDANGVMKTGWVQVNKTWYYFNTSGAMQTGWVYTGGKWYYFNSSGAMQTGWVNSGGKWYFLNSSGAMQTGWLYTGGKWYYLNSGGAMQTGWQTIAGKEYYFYSSGAMAVNTTSDGKIIGNDGAVVQDPKMMKALRDLAAFGATYSIVKIDNVYTNYDFFRDNVYIGYLEIGTFTGYESYGMNFVDGQYANLATQLSTDLGFNGTAEEIQSLINNRIHNSYDGSFAYGWNNHPFTPSPELTKAINDITTSGAVARFVMSDDADLNFIYHIYKNHQYIGAIYQMTSGQFIVGGGVQDSDLLQTAVLDLGINSTPNDLQNAVQTTTKNPNTYAYINANAWVIYNNSTNNLTFSWNP